MRINGFTGVSLINYRDRICSVVYTSPCNFKCPFCHNGALIDENPFTMAEYEVLNDINSRKNFIDGVTITGGEPTLQPDIARFLGLIHEMGLNTKMDTNGYAPEVLRELISRKLVDHVSMDIKTSPEKYPLACGVDVDFSIIEESVEILKNSRIDYDFRTTVVPGLVDKEDLREIGKAIKGAKLYVLQQYNNRETFNRKFAQVAPYADEILDVFAAMMQKYVKEVRVHNTLTAV
jgi:pyruvate formate lyase activating enzyme